MSLNGSSCKQEIDRTLVPALFTFAERELSELGWKRDHTRGFLSLFSGGSTYELGPPRYEQARPVPVKPGLNPCMRLFNATFSVAIVDRDVLQHDLLTSAGYPFAR